MRRLAWGPVRLLERAQDHAMDVACNPAASPRRRRLALAWAGLYGWPR